MKWPVPGRIRLPGLFLSLACGHAVVDKELVEFPATLGIWGVPGAE